MIHKEIMIEFLKYKGFDEDFILTTIELNPDLQMIPSYESGLYYLSNYFPQGNGNIYQRFNFTKEEYLQFKREYILNQLKG